MAAIKTKCKDSPPTHTHPAPHACEGAPPWQRKQRRWNSATAEPFQLACRGSGVEEAEIKAGVAAFMFPHTEPQSTQLQQQPQQHQQHQPAGKHREPTLPHVQNLPVRAHVFGFRRIRREKKKCTLLSSAKLKPAPVSAAAPN